MDSLKLCSAEERLIWKRSHHHVTPKDTGLVLSYTFELPSTVYLKKLESALSQLLANEGSALRNQFVEKNGTLFKYTTPISLPLLHRLQNHHSLLKNEGSEQIDPVQGKLYFFAIAPTPTGSYLFQINISHLVFDGTSYSPFIYWLSHYYNSEQKGELQTQDFSAFLSSDSETSRAFWKNKLSGVNLGQKLDFAPKTSKQPYWLEQHWNVPEAIRSQLEAFCTHFGLSTFESLLLFYGLTLFHFLPENKNLTLLHPVSHKNPESPWIGCFANFVPFIFQNHSQLNFSELAIHLRNERKSIKLHQFFSLEKILEQADFSTLQNATIFNVVINPSEGLLPQRGLILDKVECPLLRTPYLGGPFELCLHYSSSNALHLAWSASSHCFSSETLNAWVECFQKLLTFGTQYPDRLPRDAFHENKPIVPVMRGPRRNQTSCLNIYEQIQRNAELRPSKMAVSSKNSHLSYAQLLKSSSQVANQILKEVPFKSDDSIAVFVRRRELLPSVLLACLKLGIPFVPIDPSIPEQRLQEILGLAQVRLIVTDTESLKGISFRNDLNVIDLQKLLSSQDSTQYYAPPTAEENRVAYKIFTSGSTGKPKGVIVLQRNLSSFLQSMQELLPITETDRFLSLTSVAFDISLLELLFPLFIGASVYILEDASRTQPQSIAESVEAQEISVLQATPSHYQMLKAVGWQPSKTLTLLCGGEALSSELAEYLLKTSSILFHVYGPTETTIWASLIRVSDPKTISLGTPLHNTDYFVLDDQLQPVSAGAVGELVIEGDLVAAGYVDPSQNAPFVTIPNRNAPAYRTGDKVRYLGFDQLVYLGRKDDQIKFNGFRIELSEIEQALEKFLPDVRFIAVLREQPEKHICCFYSNPKSLDFSTESLNARLKTQVPSYMLPSAYVELTEIPLSISGKIDKKRLETVDILSSSTPERTHQRSSSEESSIETRLRQVFQDLFQITDLQSNLPLGSYGLNSLSFVRLSQRLDEVFGAQISPHEFYQFPTLDDLVNKLEPQKSAVVKNSLQLSSSVKDDIAIIGYSGIFPGGYDAEGLWEALCEGKNLIASSHSRTHLKTFHAGLIPDISSFDARFFSISPLEARRTDPRQRMLLEQAWKTLEHAGYTKADLAQKNVGCYVATTGSDFSHRLIRSQEEINPYSLTGTSISLLSNRLSYFFDWRGPSYTLDAACSGSLNGLVNACQDVAHGICDFALVGAANLILDDHTNDSLAAGQFLSPHSRCATFDQSADGYVRGEGVVCVLIKRLSEAITDGDFIHGVIKGYANNHGGRSTNLTAPNPNAQKELLLKAYPPELARQTTYIETHGTGTPLGDPIEVQALKESWKDLDAHSASTPVYLGALKSNIGHLESAAGLASIIKVLKSLEHQQIAPNLHYSDLNPSISLADSSFQIPSKVHEWKSPGAPLTAGVSSFGFGGANAHVVIQKFSNPSISEELRRPKEIFTFSANSHSALERIIENIRESINSTLNLVELAYTLNACRTHFRYRICVIASSLKDLQSQLQVAHPKECERRSKKKFTALELSPALELEILKEAYLEGHDIDWGDLYKGLPVRKMATSTYVFDSIRHEFPI